MRVLWEAHSKLLLRSTARQRWPCSDGARSPGESARRYTTVARSAFGVNGHVDASTLQQHGLRLRDEARRLRRRRGELASSAQQSASARDFNTAHFHSAFGRELAADEDELDQRAAELLFNAAQIGLSHECINLHQLRKHEAEWRVRERIHSDRALRKEKLVIICGCNSPHGPRLLPAIERLLQSCSYAGNVVLGEPNHGCLTLYYRPTTRGRRRK